MYKFMFRVPEGPKAEDAAKNEANLPSPLHNDKVDAVPKQINAPPDLSNPQNEANGENEADIQNGKIDDKIIDVDEGKEPGKRLFCLKRLKLYYIYLT